MLLSGAGQKPIRQLLTLIERVIVRGCSCLPCCQQNGWIRLAKEAPCIHLQHTAHSCRLAGAAAPLMPPRRCCQRGHMGSLLQTIINRCAGCLASLLLVRTDLGTPCCSGTTDAAPAAAGSLIGTRERNKVIRHA